MRNKFFCTVSLVVMGAFSTLRAEGESKEEIKPIEHYAIGAIDREEHLFQLSDGSLWLPKEKDEEKVFSWNRSTPIVFTVNEGWIGGEDYVFMNQENGESITAELVTPPKEYNHTARWIAYVDPDVYAGSVFIDNGAKFSLLADDADRFKNWKEDDFVLVGTYTSYFSPYKYLLYNYRTKDWIFVKLRDK